MSDVDTFLGGGGAPSYSWEGAVIGTGYKDAKVISSRVVQQRSYPDGEPLFWKQGSPKPTTEDTGQPVQQLEVTLYHPDWVNEPDKEGRPNTEGIKRDFFGGSKKNETSGLGSLIAALKKADSKLEPGGSLSRLMSGGEAKAGNPRQYRTKYDKPAFDPDAEEPW